MALFLLSMAVSVPLAHAGSSQQSFHIPTTITVKMYQLKSDGSRTSLLCSATNHNLETWGCTAKTDDPQHAYPFSLNPVTVDIEGNDPGDPQHGVDYNRYLRDVVPLAGNRAGVLVVSWLGGERIPGSRGWWKPENIPDRSTGRNHRADGHLYSAYNTSSGSALPASF